MAKKKMSDEQLPENTEGQGEDSNDPENKKESKRGKKKESDKSDDSEKTEDSPKLNKKFGKLSEYKAKINFKDVKYKRQEWINMSPAFKEITKLPGIPTGHIIMNYGKSDTGKSTMALEAAAFAQKQGILPVFIITENKFSFERGETMGINFEEAIVHN